MTNIPDVAETEGTSFVAAEWHIDRSGIEPSLVITLDLGDLADTTGADWQFGTVLDKGSGTGTDLTLQYIPNG